MYEMEGPQLTALGVPADCSASAASCSRHGLVGLLQQIAVTRLCFPRIAPETESILTVDVFLLASSAAAQVVPASISRFFSDTAREPVDVHPERIVPLYLARCPHIGVGPPHV
jgi:hypothetical protein